MVWWLMGCYGVVMCGELVCTPTCVQQLHSRITDYALHQLVKRQAPFIAQGDHPGLPVPNGSNGQNGPVHAGGGRVGVRVGIVLGDVVALELGRG